MMGNFRFRKSFKVAPGVRLNVGKGSVGLSAGVKGARVSTNTRTGTRGSIGLPGTGVRYEQRLKGSSSRTASTPGVKPSLGRTVLFLALVGFTVFALASLARGADMTPQTLPYNFSLYMLDALGTIPTPCDEAARTDPVWQWMCGVFPGGYEAFRTQWDVLVASPVIAQNYRIAQQDDWQPYLEGGVLDFYAKTCSFAGGLMVVAYDPDEVGREIFIGFEPPAAPVAAPATPSPAPPAPVAPAASSCVDINTADAAALTRITHVNIERADQIIFLRAQRPFRSVNELTRVSGIAEARLRDIQAQGLACVG